MIGQLFDIEVEPEVLQWLDSLSDRDYARADRKCSLLVERGHLLDEPHSKHLAEGVRELRIALDRVDARVTYWLPDGPRRIVVLLTVFLKQGRQEPREVTRALHARKTCEAEHVSGHPVTTYSRRATP